MGDSLEEVRRATAEKLGDNEDYSYITEDVLASIQSGEAKAKGETSATTGSIERAFVEEEVNTLTYQNGRYYHRNQCQTSPWYYVTSCTSTRIVNCANGLIHYRIRY